MSFSSLIMDFFQKRACPVHYKLYCWIVERRKADDMDIQDIIKHAREHKQSDLVTIIRSPAKAAEKVYLTCACLQL